MNHKMAENKQINFLQTNRKSTAITWIGHSTFLIQLGGLNILTDPIWSSFIGWKRRMAKPGIFLDLLPAIDVVLISCGRQEHLHFRTFHRLKGDPLYLVPYGLQELFMKKGIMNVKEFAWWDQFAKIPVQFTYVPAQSEVRRSLFPPNRYDCGGWICHHSKTGEHIYFAGDKGYFQGFDTIGDNFPIDLALIPIGPYKPEWFNRTSYLTPEEAVRAFLELRAGTLIPMQFGTFQPANAAGFEELNRLQVEWSNLSLSPEKLRLLTPGETWQVGAKEHVLPQSVVW